ncbi:MAG TPA: hypothetical protein VFF88_06710 [Methylocella sp.]|nr:hypothetical protein [Methylocella sp.]
MAPAVLAGSPAAKPVTIRDAEPAPGLRGAAFDGPSPFEACCAAASSFETLASQAPQDEGAVLALVAPHPAKRAQTA